MKCQVCNQETLLPFRCPFCGGQFCSAHRLPENHACPRMDFARAQTQEQVITPQAYNSYQYSYAFGQQPKRQGRISFSPTEIRNVTVAALLVIGIGFSIGLYGNYFKTFNFMWTWGLMAVFAFLMTASFLLHEFMHKVTAQRNGLWAEFRLTTWGVVLTFISIFLPFRIISPGAMMISGSPNSDEIVEISIAGPVTNLILAFVFLGSAFALYPSAWGLMLFFVAYINAWMAAFNLIPVGILDGAKVFAFNKKIWALVFIPSAILAVITFIYV